MSDSHADDVRRNTNTGNNYVCVYWTGNVCSDRSMVMLSSHYTLNGIKSKTVGDGQYGTARFATEKEIRKYMPMCPMNQSNGELESIFQKNRGW